MNLFPGDTRVPLRQRQLWNILMRETVLNREFESFERLRSDWPHVNEADRLALAGLRGRALRLRDEFKAGRLHGLADIDRGALLRREGQLEQMATDIRGFHQSFAEILQSIKRSQRRS
jgi:hypothetical protein